MLDRRMPDYWAEASERKTVLDDHYRAGRIGPAAYQLSLQILRYTPAEQKQELAFRDMEIRDGLAARRGPATVRNAGRFVDSRRAHGNAEGSP